MFFKLILPILLTYSLHRNRDKPTQCQHWGSFSKINARSSRLRMTVEDGRIGTSSLEPDKPNMEMQNLSTWLLSIHNERSTKTATGGEWGKGARARRDCQPCPCMSGEGGDGGGQEDYVQLLRFAVKQCEGVAMLPCCTWLGEEGAWQRGRETRDGAVRGAPFAQPGGM